MDSWWPRKIRLVVTIVVLMFKTIVRLKKRKRFFFSFSSSFCTTVLTVVNHAFTVHTPGKKKRGLILIMGHLYFSPRKTKESEKNGMRAVIALPKKPSFVHLQRRGSKPPFFSVGQNFSSRLRLHSPFARILFKQAAKTKLDVFIGQFVRKRNAFGLSNNSRGESVDVKTEFTSVETSRKL